MGKQIPALWNTLLAQEGDLRRISGPFTKIIPPPTPTTKKKKKPFAFFLSFLLMDLTLFFNINTFPSQ